MIPKSKMSPMENVILESFLIPFFKPKMTDVHATAVMIQMIKPFVVSESGLTLLLRRAMVVAMVVTPRPSDVHTPNVVHEMDRASMRSPMRPLTFSPKSG